jgi:hypothetical protein
MECFVEASFLPPLGRRHEKPPAFSLYGGSQLAAHEAPADAWKQLGPAEQCGRDAISACLIQCGFNEVSNCAAFQLVSQNERRFKVPDHPVTLLFEDGHGDR